MQNVILVFQELFTYCLCSLLKNACLRMDAKTVTVVIWELQVCFCIQKVESWCTMFVFQELSCFVTRAYEVVKNVVQQLSSLYTNAR